LESALAAAVEQAARTMRDAKAEIERSRHLMDGVPHPLARSRSYRNDKPDQ
jgi:hypothetical protein